MFADAFTQIEHGAAAEILDQLNPLLDGAPFDPSMARILSHSLPFYDGYRLIEVTDYDENPPRRVSFIYQEKDEIFILNGTNEPIYKLNEKLPIHLTDDIAALYVRFFFHYVRGRFGRFQIVETTDQINWREEPTPNAQKALGKMIVPIEIKKKDDNGTYYMQASIIFKDSLFESDISITKNGDVSLSNQELLVEDIPVFDDSFGQ